jgi:hypothetical protein
VRREERTGRRTDSGRKDHHRSQRGERRRKKHLRERKRNQAISKR